jgi:hypothetical protein
VLFAAISCQQAPKVASRSETLTASANHFIGLLSEGKYAEASVLFSDELKRKLPPAQLQGTWEALIKQVGALQQRTDSEVAKSKEGDVIYDVVVVKCRFERAQLNVRIAFNEGGQIAGFFVVDAS